MSSHPRDASAPAVPAAVLFDLDGTLIDSLTSMAEALVETLAARGHAVTLRAISAALGPPLEEVIASVTGLSLGEAAAAADSYRAIYYSRYVHRALPVTGADALIGRLTAAGVTLALVTMRREEYARLVLARQGWVGHFPVVVGGDTAVAPKPDPAPALHALSVLGVEAQAAAFVGDTAEDMACARAAGIATVVGFTHSRGADDLRAAGATHLASDLAAVGVLLGAPLPIARGVA